MLTEAAISGQDRLPARSEGERDDGPVDSGRARASGGIGTCRFRRTSRHRRRRCMQPSDEDMELDREMEYLAEPEEALDRGGDEGI